MSNVIDSNGLQVDSLNDIIASLTAALQTIYGADINVDSNSPDGQLINIFAQAQADMLEVLNDVYNSFSVESAYGVILDQRVALNGLTRRAGSYTTTPVVITASMPLSLTGLDALASDPTATVFTVADNAGNQFYLQTSYSFSVSGSQSLTFRAVEIGAVQVTPNTITNQVTTVLGVSGVNNPTTSGTVVGINEETDAELKIRHGQSFALASTGPADAVEAAILALPDVSDALVVENPTSVTVNGVPPYSIWPIVTGGTAAAIAQAIYAKKGIGCGQKGSQSYTITRPNGTSFVAQWDQSLPETLYIRFTINPRTVGQSFDTAFLATQLAGALKYKLGQAPTVGDIVTAMLTLAPNSYQTDLGMSTNNVDFFDVVQPSDKQHYFTVDAANITINV